MHLYNCHHQLTRVLDGMNVFSCAFQHGPSWDWLVRRLLLLRYISDVTITVVITPYDFCFTRCVVRHLGLSSKSSKAPRFHKLFYWGSSSALFCASCIGGFKRVQLFRIFPNLIALLFFVGIFMPLKSSLTCTYWGCTKLSYRISNVLLVRL